MKDSFTCDVERPLPSFPKVYAAELMPSSVSNAVQCILLQKAKPLCMYSITMLDQQKIMPISCVLLLAVMQSEIQTLSPHSTWIKISYCIQRGDSPGSSRPLLWLFLQFLDFLFYKSGLSGNFSDFEVRCLSAFNCTVTQNDLRNAPLPSLFSTMSCSTKLLTHLQVRPEKSQHVS